MRKVSFGVVVFPGSNCDMDCYHVIKNVLNQKVRYVWHEERKLDDLDCVILPGGFSYGDYLRAGAIGRFSPVMDAVIDFAEKGKLVIGICNGFQILLEAGLLEGGMLRNRTLTFVCKDVYLKVENADTPFTSLYRKGEVIKIPIAHNEGNYYISPQGLEMLRRENRIVFRYCGPSGEVGEEFNPNGALDNIAGIVNRRGNVLGMMPHPERKSEKLLSGEDGRAIFESMVRFVLKG